MRIISVWALKADGLVFYCLSSERVSHCDRCFNFPRPVSLMILMHASITEFDTNWVSRDHYREIPASTAVVACKGRVNTADKYNILSDSSKYLILKNIFIIEPFEHINIQFMRQNLTISFLDILMIFLE